MRKLVSLVAAGLLVGAITLAPDSAAFSDARPFRALAAGELAVEVTNSGDSVAPGQSLCPHPTLCTLRRAIELVNGESSDARYAITFAPAVFKPAAAGTIALLATSLPAIIRHGVTISGAGAGVVISGVALPAGQYAGLVLNGESAMIQGIRLQTFSGSCILANGVGALVGGVGEDSVTVANCQTGVEVRGRGSVVVGIRAGEANGEAAPVGTGVLVVAADVRVGSESPTGLANILSFAATGVRVGAQGAAVFSGVTVANNVFGKTSAGAVGSVNVGIDLRQPSKGTLVRANTIANATTGIRIAPDEAGLSVVDNQLAANRFEGIIGMAIDLNGDGITNANDAGDSDLGANGLRNHPVVTRAVQSRVSGTVGASCAGCLVHFYVAVHSAGGTRDYGGVPLPILPAIADQFGNFVFENPPVAPGQWVTALVTDLDGNTSEFGPSVRVGAGVVQCGNVSLFAGWNLAGFFGQNSMALGQAFPPELGLPSRVSSIHRLEAGVVATYATWLAATIANRTLDTLRPGEAYWFYSEGPATVSGGFSLSAPFPVQLTAGWNDFVYIGANGDVRDALASIANKYSQLYRWESGADGGHWLWYGDSTTPSWARGFEQLEACGAYVVRMTADATLNPLQP
jgi:hypothetical protein